jgi:hypothetical protein
MSPDVIDLLIASDLPFAWRMAWMGVMLLALAFILAGIWAVIEMVWEALPPMRIVFRSSSGDERRHRENPVGPRTGEGLVAPLKRDPLLFLDAQTTERRARLAAIVGNSVAGDRR